MNEDCEQTNWVFVQESDCKSTSNSSQNDSDQESDGSISIISFNQQDSHSEEEETDDIRIENVDEHKESSNSLDSSGTTDNSMNCSNVLYKNCSQEATLNEIEVEETSRVKQELILYQAPARSIPFNKLVGLGIFVSIFVLFASYLIEDYYDYKETTSKIPQKNFLEGLINNEKTKIILETCMKKQKTKPEYSEHIFEKCVLKKLRKRNKENEIKNTEKYLQIKEKSLNLREKELEYKEKQLVQKWHKKKHSKIAKIINENQPNKNKPKKKQNNKNTKFNEEKFKKTFQKYKFKEQNNQNEEWYIKYNPSKNTLEVISVSTLSEQESILIRNGNKTINGEWYFNLYGTSRNNIRNKEKTAEWYFKRNQFRANKRDKAKWYFDYMSQRDNSRYY